VTPFETARRAMHGSSNTQSLQSFISLLVEREKELIEELASNGNAVEVQHRFKELRLIREALSMPMSRGAPRDEG
jgi:hypothetical protein